MAHFILPLASELTLVLCRMAPITIFHASWTHGPSQVAPRVLKQRLHFQVPSLSSSPGQETQSTSFLRFHSQTTANTGSLLGPAFGESALR